MSPDTKRPGFVLKWFVLPSLAVFFVVNGLQIAPLLAGWTVGSLLGLDGAVLLWMGLIVFYSLLLALLGGLCSYRLASSRRAGGDGIREPPSTNAADGSDRNAWVLGGFVAAFVLTAFQLSPMLANVTVGSALGTPDATSLRLALTIGYSLVFASIGGLGGYAFDRLRRRL